ncbi:hypothetical protein BCR43DRAFT_486516 [Syncephalastrum racemosum]|uniref:Uncharacterized protein n=1 Tax=Syncephalastrum racemosum TaxID=13706 RepID=A0A1X2HP82_SYNRA|nr:hypothetical protein BCR43DRAFT_486516 [Syncephalastrum racemosum]
MTATMAENNIMRKKRHTTTKTLFSTNLYRRLHGPLASTASAPAEKNHSSDSRYYHHRRSTYFFIPPCCSSVVYVCRRHTLALMISALTLCCVVHASTHTQVRAHLVMPRSTSASLLAFFTPYDPVPILPFSYESFLHTFYMTTLQS